MDPLLTCPDELLCEARTFDEAVVEDFFAVNTDDEAEEEVDSDGMDAGQPEAEQTADDGNEEIEDDSQAETQGV